MLTYRKVSRIVGSRFFRVEFVKRTDGSIRVMNAKLGVKKHLSGEGAKYSFEEKGLLSVWDAVARSYRCVPLDGIIELRCGKHTLIGDGTHFVSEQIVRDESEDHSIGPVPAAVEAR